MGYDLHINRKAHWDDEHGPTISEAEWRAAIDGDPELSLDTETRYETTRGDYVFAAWNGATRGSVMPVVSSTAG